MTFYNDKGRKLPRTLSFSDMYTLVFFINYLRNKNEAFKRINLVNSKFYRLYSILFIISLYFLLQRISKRKDKTCLGLYFNNLNLRELSEQLSKEYRESVEDFPCLRLYFNKLNLRESTEHLSKECRKYYLESSESMYAKRKIYELDLFPDIETDEEKSKRLKEIWYKNCLKERASYWQKRMKYWNEIEENIYIDWYFGPKTKKMDKEWKDKKWNEWFEMFSKKMWKEDMKDTKSFKKKIKREYSLEVIVQSFMKKEKSFEKKKIKIMKEWDEFVNISVEQWENEKK
ncbi:Plasmodium exported protein, unknown function [Plasmodium gallinaceum]|uniref:Uncharacterized protein n=1 Tax=Plasmodium gallinaceum TaxID=5849 RepID=A0A1J1GU71_PLAGA|nr:Plasmodium exported protein, unknown function [Plasmodium gallinaceum]CRG96081.1 Plasmodium exported protein, unknown function [Plasmodium gallinaceum]